MENAPVDTPVEQLGKFVVIKDGRVLFEAEKLMEAIKECVHRTGGAVYGRLANIPIEEGATE
ncbi:hypothetical protein [Schlesneria sp. DSM 10557]|uniref:hypothetical protein n=1 Tax=Schlesneria sp. DSM 10557 TaxID=3044399 RepID=UPI0035A09DC0